MKPAAAVAPSALPCRGILSPFFLALITLCCSICWERSRQESYCGQESYCDFSIAVAGKPRSSCRSHCFLVVSKHRCLNHSLTPTTSFSLHFWPLRGPTEHIKIPQADLFPSMPGLRSNVTASNVLLPRHAHRSERDRPTRPLPW